MPLSETLTRIAGVLMHNGVARGTCFRLTVPSETFPNIYELSAPYLVTAAHCLPPDPSEAVVLMPDKDGVPHELKQRLEWRVHPTYLADPTTGVDIAAARIRHEDLWWFATDIRDSVESFGVPLLGTDLVYFGLLSPVASMVKRGQAMVRSATLGAISVEDVTYSDDPSGSDHCASEAHLVDCRSLGGFSGSPVFLDAAYPGPPEQPIPHGFRQQIARVRPDLADIQMQTLHHFFVLFGMLVAYADYDGVAIVLPFKRIQEIVNLEAFVTERRELDEKVKKAVKQSDSGFRSASVSDEDRVKLPVDFEDALKGLLNTPPHVEE